MPTANMRQNYTADNGQKNQTKNIEKFLLFLQKYDKIEMSNIGQSKIIKIPRCKLICII